MTTGHAEGCFSFRKMTRLVPIWPPRIPWGLKADLLEGVGCGDPHDKCQGEGAQAAKKQRRQKIVRTTKFNTVGLQHDPIQTSSYGSNCVGRSGLPKKGGIRVHTSSTENRPVAFS